MSAIVALCSSPREGWDHRTSPLRSRARSPPGADLTTSMMPTALPELGQRLVGVECGGRRQGPLERSGAGTPWIARRSHARAEVGVEHAEDEHDRACRGDVGADGGPPVPVREGIGVVDIAARHAGETKE